MKKMTPGAAIVEALAVDGRATTLEPMVARETGASSPGNASFEPARRLEPLKEVV